MTPAEYLLLGYALGVIPAVAAGRLAVAAVGKRLGVSPKDVQRYGEATDGDDDGGETGQ